jgi:hypothetical protein
MKHIFVFLPMQQPSSNEHELALAILVTFKLLACTFHQACQEARIAKIHLFLASITPHHNKSVRPK